MVEGSTEGITTQTMEIQQPKPYELDWSKVKSFTDVILLLKLITGATDKKVDLYLYDSQVDQYKHLFKENKEESDIND